MEELLRQPRFDLELMPALEKMRTDMATAPDAPTALPELLRFVDRVLCDGRFVTLVTDDPQGVARKLGFDLSPETESRIKEHSLDTYLSQLWEVRFPNIISVGPFIVGIIIAVIVGIVIIGILWIVADRMGEKRNPPVNDRSEYASLKM